MNFQKWCQFSLKLTEVVGRSLSLSKKTFERGHRSYALKFLISITVVTAMSDRIDQIIEKLHQLKEIRQQLINAPMSEPGAWIHQYEVRKQYKKGGEIYWYVYAKWQANEPIFKRNPKARLKGIVKRGKNPEYTCHQHIGRVSSSTGLGTDPEVAEASISGMGKPQAVRCG
ncbi:hypothetical protein [uncultured Nostoc sp.]|uniref:hypothetical protein n=1 Tax=uncultured Nostoc sp. TaxID=340711 RepID=UPI0035C98F73